MAPEPVPPRTVRPLTLKRDRLPIIAVSMRDGRVLLEREQESGMVRDLDELPTLILQEPPSLFIVDGAAVMLKHLDEIYTNRPDWQYRVTPDKRDIRLPNQAVGRVEIRSTVVNFFGFRPPEGKKIKGHYHHPVDPQHFCRKGIHDLRPGAEPLLVKLMEWGKDVRDWCATVGVTMKPSAGGIAGQLLRHPDFFSRDRRKVPRVTNARARLTLPGNFYRLYTKTGVSCPAYYLDMKTAHHNIASTLGFPDPDTLNARGWFWTAGGTGGTDGTDSDGKSWLDGTTRAFRRVLANARGLLYVHLSVPKIPAERFPPPYLETPGQRMAWIYTNELPMLRELGAVIDYVSAGWCSFDTCRGVNKYAAWAMEQLDQAQALRREWLKPTLLATYGVLAARPRVVEYGFRQANGGVAREYPAGSGMIQAQARITETAQEVPVANVIYRGMIEAEQRKRSLDMARVIHSHGGRVLAVYADSVFVDSRGFQLPILPTPWVIEAELDRLIFLSSTAFTSEQVTKMPGVPRESAAYVRELERISRSVRR